MVCIEGGEFDWGAFQGLQLDPAGGGSGAGLVDNTGAAKPGLSV